MTIVLAILHPRIFLLGLRECRSALGMTYDHPDTLRSRAYDKGRYLGWRIHGIH